MQTLVNEAPADGAGKAVGPDSFLTLHYRVALENDTDVVTTFGDKPAAAPQAIEESDGGEAAPPPPPAPSITVITPGAASSPTPN